MSRESNNQKHINPTMLETNNETKPTESIKRDSMQETSISTESSTLKSNYLESKKPNDTKNKDNIKLDSHGDEIVYEVRHRLGISDTIQYIIMFMFGIALVYVGIRGFVLADRMDGVMFAMLLGIPCGLSSFYRLFCARKDRFYVANNGIGFEYRHWFVMQKGFFRFGEVGLALFCLPAPVYFDSSKEIFIIHPINITYKLMAFPRLRDKNYKHYIFCKVLTELYHDDIKAILVFIRQKTKEALESQGIEISDSELKDKFKHLLYKDI
ncbi:hypothetical protein [Helicobacter trogontum]|uniref:hypothetical protein n=1 Tax=Helicobacter trogontum TaxID=50960 RepID=UPI001F16870D|nr:hypothetical protein [Helicobacter trogontum]